MTSQHAPLSYSVSSTCVEVVADFALLGPPHPIQCASIEVGVVSRVAYSQCEYDNDNVLLRWALLKPLETMHLLNFVQVLCFHENLNMLNNGSFCRIGHFIDFFLCHDVLKFC